MIVHSNTPNQVNVSSTSNQVSVSSATTQVRVSTLRSGTSGTSGQDGNFPTEGSYILTGSLNVSGSIILNGRHVDVYPYIELTNKLFSNPDIILSDPIVFTKPTDNEEVNIINGVMVYNVDQVDIINDDIHITRNWNAGHGNLYNPLIDEGSNDVSPSGTLWNTEGWDNLGDIIDREYKSFIHSINSDPSTVTQYDFIMYDTINKEYYTIRFSEYSTSFGDTSFSYTRRKLDISGYYFEKSDAGSEVDIIDSENNIAITRSTLGPLYNPLQELDYQESISPAGTLWNSAGWSDLSNITSRNYTDFVTELDYNIAANILNRDMVMYIPVSDVYYGIKFLSWTGVSGHGFSYVKYRINPDQYNEGIKFADNTIQTTAYTPLTSTAFGSWKITEVVGNNLVTLTENVPVIWYTNEIDNFRGAIINYHAYVYDTGISGGGTIIGTIHISRDGSTSITHTESKTGSVDFVNNVELWYTTGSGTDIYFRMLNNDYGKLKIHWSATTFCGNDFLG